MLDTATKKKIDDCRDILVGKLPDPKAQIEQITIGLIYKFMNDMDNEAIELGGQAKFFANYKVPDPEYPNDRDKDKIVEFKQYAWDNLLAPKVTATKMLSLYSEAIAGMDKNPNIPQLFRDIFKNAYLPYRDPETLKMFLKTIAEFEYTHSEKLGDAFEYLLSVMGSQGDAGQFRTPRHIIDFLVAIVDPGKNDTILDPACGTAGFLISAFKHIKEKNNNELTPDERKKLIRNFVGYDISPDMVRLSLVNLYLHGFSDPHIYEYDTLSSEERWNESFDVILANPPFMSPKGGIRPHKKFTISSNRSEVLFVDYIAEHLNPKGKAGIIVPEGVIFQSGIAYKALRKMLVENHLYAVVSLPSGIFNPYSGVKTSILLMDRSIAKLRKEILFLKIDNDGYNLGAQRSIVKGSQLEEAIELTHEFIKTGELKETPIAHAVLKTEISKNGDYSLSGNKYKISHILNSEFEFVALGEIFRLSSGAGLTNSQMRTGPYPVYGGNGIIGYHSDFFVEKPTIVIGRVGAYCGSIHITTPDAWVTDNALYITEYFRKDVNQTYLALMLDALKLNRFAKVGGQPSISQSTVKEQKIPLPPLSIQEEIVAEVKVYKKIIDGANAVVANYSPQIYIKPDWEMVEFEDAPFQIIDGDRGSNYPNSDDFSEEGYCLFLNTKNVRPNGFNFDDRMFVSKEQDERLRKGKLTRNDVILTTRGTIGNTAYYSESVPFEHVRINSGMVIFRPNKELLFPEYLFYFFQSENCQSQFKRIISGAAQPQLPIRSIKSAVIPLPDLETQRQIVSQIQKEQKLVNANKQLIEIFEQKIKDRIGKVWGK